MSLRTAKGVVITKVSKRNLSRGNTKHNLGTQTPHPPSLWCHRVRQRMACNASPPHTGAQAPYGLHAVHILFLWWRYGRKNAIQAKKLGKRQKKNITLLLHPPPICGDTDCDKGCYARQPDSKESYVLGNPMGPQIVS